MQTVNIPRRYGYDFLGALSVKVDAPAGTSAGRLLGLALLAALSTSADLSGADLSGADLRSADLRSADLRSADLRSADLRSANLRSANLSGANLSGADLRSANLSGADLSGADLRSADLRSADLRSANLRSADLRSADLRSANLSGADLDVNTRFPGYQIPQEGALIVWKKLRDGSLCKLQIPAKARRTGSHVGRKCRAEFAKVIHLERVDGTKLPKEATGYSSHVSSFAYKAGVTVTPDRYNDSPLVECAPGIHFFLSRDEAVAY